MNLGAKKKEYNKLKSSLVIAMTVAVLLPCSAFSVENSKTANSETATKTAENKTPVKTVSQKRESIFQAFMDKLAKRKANREKITKNSDPNESEVSSIKGGVILTINDCIDYALKNDPIIKKYANTQKAQKSAVGIAKSSYFPTLYGGTGYNIKNTKYFGDRSDSVNNNYYGINAGINQLIWDFGYTTANINMNKYNWEASGYDLDNAILDSIYNVKTSYTAVLAARANEDIYARSVRINELNVERTRAMYDVGLKSKIDVVNAEATLTEARISLIDAQNTYQLTLIDLNNSMYYVGTADYLIKDTETFNFQKNYSIKNEINVAYDRKNFDGDSVEAEIKDGAILTSGIEKRDILKTYNFKPFELTMQEAINKAYENRPDLKSLRLVQKASEESLKAIKRSYYPAINASGGYSMMKQTDLGSNAIAVYAGVDLPNVNAMEIKNRIEQGKSYLDVAINNVDLLKKNIYFDVQAYYVNMKKLEKTIPLKSKRVEQTLENFELADGRYAVGLSNYLELQQAQTDYNNAQLAFVQSVFDYNNARFYLEKAIGLK